MSASKSSDNSTLPKSVFIGSVAHSQVKQSLKNSRINVIKRLLSSKVSAANENAESIGLLEHGKRLLDGKKIQCDANTSLKQRDFLRFLEGAATGCNDGFVATIGPSFYRNILYYMDDRHGAYKLVQNEYADPSDIEFQDPEFESIWKTVKHAFQVNKVESRYAITFGEANTTQEVERLQTYIADHPDQCMYCADVSHWAHDEDDSWVSKWRFHPFEHNASGFDFFGEFISMESASSLLFKWYANNAPNSYFTSTIMAFAGAFDKAELEISIENLSVTGVIVGYSISPKSTSSAE